MSSSDAGTVGVPDDRQEAEVNPPLERVTWWVGEVEQQILQDPQENEYVHVNDEMFVDLEDWE